jgi:hypothetical protein
MLFRIDESVSELLTSSAATNQDAEALSCLALGAAEGSHRITGARKVLAQLSQLQSLSLGARKTLERAAGRVAQEGHLHLKLQTFGHVVSNTQTVPSAAINRDQRVITFPLRWFDRSAKIQPTSLLGENLSDVRVFTKIGEVGTVLSALDYLPIVASPTNGGGSTIGKVLGQLVASNRICLCIVDSDKVCPTSNVGGTARSVAPYSDINAYPMVEVLETTGRDLENALPNSFFLSRYGNDPKNIPMTNLLAQLGSQGEVEVRAHVDIECGLVLREIWSHSPTSHEANFWRNKLNQVFALVGVLASSFPCLATETCAHPIGCPCVCVVVPGNRANILDDFLALYEGADRFVLRNMLDDSVREDWRRLGRAIASWCCGDSRLRV